MRILVMGDAGYLGSMLAPALLGQSRQVTVLDTFALGVTLLNTNCVDRTVDAVGCDTRDMRVVEPMMANRDVIIPLQPHRSVRGYALAREMLAIGQENYGTQYGLPWLHCILATVCYGPHAHTEAHRSHFMAALIARAAAAKSAGAREFEVWGSPDTVRDLLFVTDQIEAIIAADQAFKNRIVSLTSNQPVTIGACARGVLAALDWDAPVVSPPGSFQGAGYKSLDSSRFLAATGWQPCIPLEEGVRLSLATLP